MSSKITDDTTPFWKAFPNALPGDFKWIEPGLYPMDEWLEFVMKKTPDERKKYFDRWKASKEWRLYLSDEFQHFLNTADDGDDN